MSLNGALQVGRSGLIAAQAGIQVAGNNMANAATKGYSRQILHLSPARGEQLGRGQFVGGGVRIDDITRAVDVALQGRLRDAVSDEFAATINQRFLTALETVQNELSENDLSTLLSDFFNGFSELANNPEDGSIRSVLIEQAVTLTDRISQMQNDYRSVLEQVDRDLGAAVDQANDILSRLTEVNRQIALAENGVGMANSLRDQRDQFVNELAELMDISTIEQPNGSVDVFVGSTPIVLAGESRGLHVREEEVDGELVLSVRLDDDESRLDIRSGRIGALIEQRNGPISEAIDDLDMFAAQLIHQVNRLHSQGQGQQGFESVSGTYRVEDTTANLNHIDAALPFSIENGSFLIHVTHQATGTREAFQINVDGDSMSLDDLINEINNVVGVPNVTAGVNAGNQLQLDAAAGYEISFSDDSAGVLAALGINTFFTGEGAADIAVNEIVRENPSMLAAGLGHVEGSNGTALAIADLQNEPIDSFGDQSLREFWAQSVNKIAVAAGAAVSDGEAARLVRESLEAQVASVSGVSLDEEAINLLTFQRQFQAAARFISVIDETLQVLLSLA